LNFVFLQHHLPKQESNTVFWTNVFVIHFLDERICDPTRRRYLVVSGQRKTFGFCSKNILNGIKLPPMAALNTSAHSMSDTSPVIRAWLRVT
jgi:hypothetical protein